MQISANNKLASSKQTIFTLFSTLLSNFIARLSYSPITAIIISLCYLALCVWYCLTYHEYYLYAAKVMFNPVAEFLAWTKSSDLAWASTNMIRCLLSAMAFIYLAYYHASQYLFPSKALRYDVLAREYTGQALFFLFFFIVAGSQVCPLLYTAFFETMSNVIPKAAVSAPNSLAVCFSSSFNKQPIHVNVNAIEPEIIRLPVVLPFEALVSVENMPAGKARDFSMFQAKHLRVSYESIILPLNSKYHVWDASSKHPPAAFATNVKLGNNISGSLTVVSLTELPIQPMEWWPRVNAGIFIEYQSLASLKSFGNNIWHDGVPLTKVMPYCIYRHEYHYHKFAGDAIIIPERVRSIRGMRVSLDIVEPQSGESPFANRKMRSTTNPDFFRTHSCGPSLTAPMIAHIQEFRTEILPDYVRTLMQQNYLGNQEDVKTRIEALNRAYFVVSNPSLSLQQRMLAINEFLFHFDPVVQFKNFKYSNIGNIDSFGQQTNLTSELLQLTKTRIATLKGPLPTIVDSPAQPADVATAAISSTMSLPTAALSSSSASQGSGL